MSIAFGGIVAFFFRGLNLLVALLTVYITAHELGDAGRGTFVLGTTLVGIASAFTGGITAAAAFQVSNQRRAAGAVMVNGSLVAGGLALFAILAGIAGRSMAPGDWASIAPPAAAAASAVILISVVSGVFLGRGALVRYNVALVLPPFFAFCGVLFAFFVLQHESPVTALYAFAAGQWASLPILAFLGSSALFEGLSFDRRLMVLVLRFAALAGLASAVSYLNYRADTFVVEHFEGEAGVGVYSSAVLITESVWQFSGALALAAYPRMGSLDRIAAATLTSRVMRHTLVILAVVCGSLFLVAPLLVSVLPASFAGASTALRILLPGTLLYGLASALSGFYTYQRGMPWVSAVIAGGGLAIDLVLDVALIPSMGINGAALASSIAYTVAIAAALVAFMLDTRESPASVLLFGKADLQDYRTLIGRLRAVTNR